MVIKYTKENRNLIGFIMGITYTIVFNAYFHDKTIDNSIAFSLPFLLFAALLGIGISKVRKDKNSGVYFAVISLLLIIGTI